jgi:hypothetical protein
VYVYALSTARLDVWDYTDPTAPTHVSNQVVTGGGGTVGKVYADDTTFWFQNAKVLYPFTWAGNEDAPVQLTSLNPCYDMGFRTPSTTANLMVRVNSNNQIDSRDLADPAVMVRVNPSPDPLALPTYLIEGGLLYDSVTGRAIVDVSNGFNYGAIAWYDVSAGGQVSYNTERQYSVTSAAGQGQSFVYDGYYWFWYFSAWRGYPLSGVGAQVANAFDQYFFGVKPIVVGDYAIMSMSIANVLYNAVSIVDLTTFTIVAGLGGTNKTSNSVTIVGDTLIFAVGTTIYAYDITTPASPALLSTLTSPTVEAAPQGLIGVPWTETIP